MRVPARRDEASARRSSPPAWAVAAFVALSMMLWSLGHPRAALAQAATIALHVEGPDAQAVRTLVLDALPPGIQLVDEKVFRAQLVREGQVRPLGKGVDPSAIDRVRRAARVAGVAAAVVVRVRRDHKATRALVLVVPAWTTPSSAEEATLALNSHDDDVAAITSALGQSLEPYAPQPARPSPSAPTPLPSPQPDQGEERALSAKPAPASSDRVQELPSTPIVPTDAAPAPSRRRWTPPQLASSVVDLAVAAGVAGRRFDYRSGIQPGASRYTLSPAPEAILGVQLFPLAHARAPWGDIGIVGNYVRIFSVLNDTGSVGADAFPSSYSAGLRARIHPGSDPRLIVGLSLEYAFASRRQVGPSGDELPAVVYRSLRPAVDTRVRLGRFSLVDEIGFHAVLDRDAISPRFYAPQGYGLDAELGGALALDQAIEARLAVDYELYSFGFTPPPGATFGTGSARDQMYGARIVIAFVR
jgi:hypothetical protein